MINEKLHTAAQKLLPELVALRRELHARPEIRFEEKATSDRIARFMDENRIPYTRGWARGTGIVAELKGAGPATVALRADIDALELCEMTNLPYASATPNRMHACGHDGHMACLCGTAKLLAQCRDLFDNTVRFIFQPAEEIGGGGRFMAEEGAVDGADVVFGMHAWPELPAGKIGVRNGPAMAGADSFEIVVRGEGCHGAHPDKGVDPIVACAHIVTALQTIASRELDPLTPLVVTVAKIEAGFAENIIPESARMEGTFRTFTKDAHDRVRNAIARIAPSIAAAFRAEAQVRFGQEMYIPVINDPGATRFATDAVAQMLGADAVVEIDKPSMGAEDFAYYLEKVPGSFLMLGIQDRERSRPSLHSPHFDFNDDSILTGILAMAALAVTFTQGGAR